MVRTTVQDSMDAPDSMKEVLALAKAHDLGHIVANFFLENKILPENEPQLQTMVFKALYRYEGQKFEFDRVRHLLEEKAIPFIPLKGAFLRDFYPEPWYRTSCDIDILVKKEDATRAKELIIKALGYEHRGDSTHDITLFSKGGVCLELHFDLQESDFRTVEVLDNIWEGDFLVPITSYEYKMTNELFLFYHIYHMAKHFVHGGSGIRTLLDLWLLKNKMDYDKECLTRLLSDGGLTAFSESAMTLVEVWFGTATHTTLTEEMESYILSAGVYGTQENRIAIAQSREGGKGKYLLSRLFPSYTHMTKLYPRLEKCASLLPWYYLVRAFRFLFKKEKAYVLSEIRQNATVSDDKIGRAHV